MTMDESGDHNYRVRQYPKDHRGPYEVFIRKIDMPLNHIEISKTMNEKYNGVVLSLMKINIAKIKVVFSDLSSANNLHKEPFLEHFRVYIPAASVEIDGIITVSTDSDDGDLIANGKGKFRSSKIELNIIDTYRFMRRVGVESNKEVFEKTSAIRVTFEGTRLPDFVSIFGLAIPVKPHVPKIMHCENCLNFGHTIKYCAAKPICKKCAGSHKSDSCNEIPHICIHCKKNVDHSVKQNCPVYVSHKKKLIEKAKSRVSHSQPVNQFQNYFSVLSSQSQPEPETNVCNIDLSPPGKRRREEIIEKLEPQASTSRQNSLQVSQNLSFAEVVGANFVNSKKNRPKNRKSRSKKSGPNVSVGRTNEPSTVENKTEPESKQALKDAIRARVVSFKMHPIVQQIIVSLISPALDLFWPIISSFVPFLLPLLTQNGDRHE